LKLFHSQEWIGGISPSVDQDLQSQQNNVSNGG